MVDAFLRIEVLGALAAGDAAVPFVEHEVGAAEQIVRFGVGRGMGNAFLEGLNSVIDATGGEKFIGRFRRVGLREEQGTKD
jgi:hypothetical protein